MRESFSKFKNKILIESIIKALSIGLAFGLIVFSIPLLVIKLMKIEFNTLYLVLIGIGVFIVVSGLIFILLLPTNKKAAKRIDNELSLNEKVQTMIEFEKDDSYMATLQREDTLNILSRISIKKLSMRFGLFFFIIIGLSCIVTVTALAVPKYEAPGEIIVDGEDDPDYDLDDWTIRAIKDIIEVVEESTIVESLKVVYIDELNSLITELESASKESQMKEYVLDTIDEVRVELDKVNSNNEVFTVLSETDTALVLSLAIQIYQLNVANVENVIEGFVILVSGSGEAIVELDDSFGYILRKSNLNQNDALVKALINFTNAINDCRTMPNINESMKSLVEYHKEIISEEISKQANNKDIANYIVNNLVNIFGLQGEVSDDEIIDDELGNDSNGGPAGDNKNDNESTNNSGGLGTGDVIFGSNDLFYDPEEGTVEYGDVIAKYYGIIIGQLEDGTIPEALKEYFNYYYDILFGDFNEESEK